MLGLSHFRHKLFEFQAFHNQAHIINFTGIIIYFCGTYYLYAIVSWVLSKIINNSNFSTMFVPPILRGSPLQAQLHASVVRMHAMNEWMSKEQLESISRNKFTTNKVLSYRPKDDDVSTFKKGTRPRQDHLVAATSWPSPEAKVTSVKWPVSGRAEDDLGCDEFLCLEYSQ